MAEGSAMAQLFFAQGKRNGVLSVSGEYPLGPNFTVNPDFGKVAMLVQF
jgi:hypothetical protein